MFSVLLSCDARVSCRASVHNILQGWHISWRKHGMRRVQLEHGSEVRLRAVAGSLK